MSTRRAHEVVTDDSVTIRATVLGQGPPLVFLQGVMGDGDVDWQALVPHLAARYTCHLPSMRGRGRSDDHPNLQIDRIGTDYTAYVESLGEPAGLVGWSAGAGHALAVSARSEAVTATASYEPVVGALMDDEEREDLISALAHAREMVKQGDLPGAMRAFAAHPFTPDDIAAADDSGYFAATGSYAPHVLRVFEQVAKYTGVRPEDPEVLGAITTPALVLHGSETRPFFKSGAQHLVDKVADARRCTIPHAGHAGPITHPEVVAQELREFFDHAFAQAHDRGERPAEA